MIKGRKVYDPLTDTWSTGYWIVDDKGNYYPVWQKGVAMNIDEAITHAREVASRMFDDRVHCIKCAEEHEQLAEWLTQLKEYQQLEEQGRLIKLPCKEAYTESGDIVYLIYDDEVVECTHCGLSINPVDGKAYIVLATDEDIFPYRRPVPEYDLDPTDWCTNTIDAEVGEIGKTVFFTKSAAEEKLKELRRNND